MKNLNQKAFQKSRLPESKLRSISGGARYTNDGKDFEDDNGNTHFEDCTSSPDHA